MSEYLRLLEHEVHIAALSFMAIAYTLRIMWLMRFRAGAERTWAAGPASGAAARSLLAVAKPWTIEGSRGKPLFYVQFVIFHLGAATAISLTFLIPYKPELLAYTPILRALQMMLGAAFVVGLLRLYRRISDPALKLISTPDDYFALIMMTTFYAAGIGALSPTSTTAGRLFLPMFFLMAAFFHFYVPFSKIIHYLYYPFTRYYLGKAMAHRNIGNDSMSQ